MTTTTGDLRGLRRDTDGPSQVPTPGFHWKTRLLLPGAILATVLGVLVIASAQTLLPATPVRVVPVVVKTVEGARGTVTVQAPGWLEPDPHAYHVPALADGVVEQLLVLEGDRVEAGDVVARLIDDDARIALRRVEAELGERRAALRSAEAELAAARLQLEHLIEPSRVAAVAESAVAEVRAEIDKARADVAVERAVLAEIRDEYDRKAKLTSSQAVSTAVVERLRLRLEAQEAAVRSATARQAVLASRLEKAEADLRAATTSLDLLIDERRAVALAEAAVTRAESAVTLAEAYRDEAALRLVRMAVRAPVSGIVLRRKTAPGSKLTRSGDGASADVLDLYDPERLQVRVDVPLADAAHVSVGQEAEVTVEVLPDRTFAGRVTRIVHQADIQKNTVEVKVAVEAPSPELKPEMLARVRFLARDEPTGGTIRQRIFAPAGLLRDDGDGGKVALAVVELVDERGRLEQRSVVPGARRIEGWVEIESGLQVGDLLVADPRPGLEAGDRVRVVGEQQDTGG